MLSQGGIKLISQPAWAVGQAGRRREWVKGGGADHATRVSEVTPDTGMCRDEARPLGAFATRTLGDEDTGAEDARGGTTALAGERTAGP
jgi:hypothetical protein